MNTTGRAAHICGRCYVRVSRELLAYETDTEKFVTLNRKLPLISSRLGFLGCLGLLLDPYLKRLINRVQLARFELKLHSGV